MYAVCTHMTLSDTSRYNAVKLKTSSCTLKPASNISITCLREKVQSYGDAFSNPLVYL